jgi:hypothetical protein
MKRRNIMTDRRYIKPRSTSPDSDKTLSSGDLTPTGLSKTPGTDNGKRLVAMMQHAEDLRVRRTGLDKRIEASDRAIVKDPKALEDRQKHRETQYQATLKMAESATGRLRAGAEYLEAKRRALAERMRLETEVRREAYEMIQSLESEEGKKRVTNIIKDMYKNNPARAEILSDIMKKDAKNAIERSKEILADRNRRDAVDDALSRLQRESK